ncbi:helix-turn-helix domain-containing protein [Rufibacter latericius]|uniref:DNA-binding protein n=1 Tax=Rufibacter latericius TaxID=2487040 RepID=A0A3M9MDB4_9BACT|nr:helix-turn-helix domain-containing protein [Rufibacter latericius]RNI23561.1 DNA-binding protein [Rufibacter latericius]
MTTNVQLGNQLGQILAQGASADIELMIYSCFSKINDKLNANEEIMKPEEVCDFLKVSMPTLNNLVKSGNFNSYDFKNAKGIYYKRSEIIQALRKRE